MAKYSYSNSITPMVIAEIFDFGIFDYSARIVTRKPTDSGTLPNAEIPSKATSVYTIRGYNDFVTFASISAIKLDAIASELLNYARFANAIT